LLDSYFEWLKDKEIEKATEERRVEEKKKELEGAARDIENAKRAFFGELRKGGDRDALIKIASGMSWREWKKFWTKKRRNAFLDALSKPERKGKDIRFLYDKIRSRCISLEKQGKFRKELLPRNLLPLYIDFRDAPGAADAIRMCNDGIPRFDNRLLALHRNHPSSAAALMWAVKRTAEQCESGNFPKEKPSFAVLEKDRKNILFLQRAIEKGDYPWNRFYKLLCGIEPKAEESAVAASLLKRLQGAGRENLVRDILILQGFKWSVLDALMHAALRAVPGWDEKLANEEFPGSDKICEIIRDARREGKFEDDEFFRNILDSRIRVRDADGAESLLFTLQNWKMDQGLADYLLFLARVYPGLADAVPAMAVKAFVEEYRLGKKRRKKGKEETIE
jgi:hypothetical protein